MPRKTLEAMLYGNLLARSWENELMLRCNSGMQFKRLDMLQSDVIEAYNGAWDDIIRTLGF
jgi:hypothetical protein